MSSWGVGRREGKAPPQWQAHDAADYNRDMTDRCTKLLGEIVSDPARRQAILADPRDLHRELFAPFTPPGHSEYAGTYRGAPGSTLADRRMSSESQLEPGVQYEFCLPGEVVQRMSLVLEHARTWLNEPNTDDYGKLIGLTYTFCWFGKIHPFLDGNGHVQRALFAAMATGFGYSLSPRFAIHPRPFDRLLATALEIFTRAPAGRENEELGLVAEYLGFFLDGPFNAPRKHVGTATPYV
ncbi:Fido domain-containing protein [Chelatococcus asaccharovorans]|nr:Fido domain-containing protein [Chelatococcus asaccharovorans]CAH1682459.1 Fido domain-containing protein [Chelatococcus asaccharovorans]